MSVLKSKRKPSQFEVFHHFYKMRREVTSLLLRDFGFDLERAEKNIRHTYFTDRSYEELTPEEQHRYDNIMKRYLAFVEWFIADERQSVTDCLRTIGELVFTANSIYPSIKEELVERRLLQDKAIGQCYRLTQELQYAIETLPVDMNKYTRFAELIQTEINLLKGWRKSDNKFKRAISDSASRFAYVNDTGLAYYNLASYSYGVRPDFDTVIK